jgi:hypothetical protein
MELKVTEIAELYDFNLVLIISNSESGKIYSFRSSDSFRPNIVDTSEPWDDTPRSVAYWGKMCYKSFCSGF